MGEKKWTGCREKEGKRKVKGREGQTHLRGGKGESVRVSREGEIRDMTHHAGAAHWRANTLEAKEKGSLQGCDCCCLL